MVCSFGDSLIGSPRTTVCTNHQLCGWVENATAALATANPGRNFVANNHAIGGQQQIDSFALATLYVSLNNVSFAVWQPWSQNDGHTSAIIQADYDTYVAAFIALCRAHNTVPILMTALPSTVTSAAEDNTRKSVNNQIRALASPSIIVADTDSVVTDGASPARYLSGYSADGIHPNTTASAALMPILRDAIQAYLNQAT